MRTAPIRKEEHQTIREWRDVGKHAVRLFSIRVMLLVTCVGIARGSVRLEDAEATSVTSRVPCTILQIVDNREAPRLAPWKVNMLALRVTGTQSR